VQEPCESEVASKCRVSAGATVETELNDEETTVHRTVSSGSFVRAKVFEKEGGVNVGKSTECVAARPGIDGADAAMERYSKGDGAAFAELYDAIAPRLLGFLRKATRDDGSAEDLMQQTLLHIHRERGSFIPGARVMPWAYAIARRLMIDGARRRRLERRLFSDASADDDRTTYEPTAATAGADDLLHARRLEGRVLQRLGALPEGQRTAYRLLQQEGLSLKGAAEVLGTSVNAVKLRAHRAYAALRAVLREAGEAP
jgi:RNA polymerase sigma-70 factor (ECF subfamily)